MVLRRWIPELFWTTIFGPPYVKLFGRDRLLSAPCFSAEEIGPSIIRLQLSKSIYEMRDSFDQLDGIRSAVKRHLDVDAFWRRGAPCEHQYVVPNELAEVK
jgi:hypothetical protein